MSEIEKDGLIDLLKAPIIHVIGFAIRIFWHGSAVCFATAGWLSNNMYPIFCIERLLGR